MSKLLQERWLRLSGLLLEEEEKETPDLSWYKGMASGDNIGTTVVSEIGFCISLMDGGSLPTEAKLLEAAQGDCFGAVDSTKQNILKYVPAMKLHTKGGTDEVSYQLQTAQKAAQKAISYIESTFQQEVVAEGGEATKATITGVQHMGVVAAKGDGGNTGDVVVSFTDGDGGSGTQKISLKSYENIDEKTVLTKQAISLADRFKEFYPTVDHPMLAKYLRELKAQEENPGDYKPLAPFRVITDWAYMKAGVKIKDLMVADIDNESSGYSQARNSALSGKKNVRSFNWTTDSRTTTDTQSQVDFTAEEIAAMKDDADNQRRGFAQERVPDSDEFNRGPQGQSKTPKKFQKGGAGRSSTAGSEAAGGDYAMFNA